MLSAPGSVLAGGHATGKAAPPIATPFGQAEPIEGTEVRSVPVGAPAAPVRDAAFADGIQRFAVEGWVGVVPIVRAYVASAVMRRQGGALTVTHDTAEEFIVAALDALPPGMVHALEQLPMPLYDAGRPDRHHPIVDLQRAADVVDARRRHAERSVVRAFRQSDDDTWLVVDGALRGHDVESGDARVLGAIKSHETQFLAGADLESALTLGEGERTTVFARGAAGEDRAYSWYLRLWDWTGRDILFGLVRLERPAGDDVVTTADEICRWMLAERAPISDDGRWDRLLYPIHEVENYLRARAGGWQ